MKAEKAAMWKWCAGFALAVGLLVAAPQAASAQIVTFDFAGLTGSEVAATNNAKDANLANTVITRSAALFAAANGDRFNATNWAVGSIANAVASNRYMQFTVTPNSGYQFAVTSVVVKWQRSATGNSQVSLRSSVDSYASDIGSAWVITDSTTTQTNTWTLSQANTTNAVTYRLYSYAEAAGGTGGPGDGVGNDISIYGSVTAAVTEPTTHASGLSFTAVGSSGMTVNWTSGDGANRIVVVREGAATSWTPTDGVAPSGVNADFSAATDQADGNKICYDGSGATFDLSGLSAGTTYYVTIFEYNGSGGTVNYYTGGTPLAGSQATAAATGIWINPMSAGTPMGSYYLGDTLGDWFVNFEIGQASWDYAQVGLGTSLAGTGYNWGVANWYEDGEGSNKRVRRNLTGTQFTSAGSYYVICQARANSGDAYTSKSGNGWDNQTAYPPADLSSAYFTVNGLTAASDVTAAKDATFPATRVDLGWTRWNDRNVLITVATASPSGSPVDGTAYVANDSFGNQTVVSGSQAGTSLEVTGLTPGQTYYFTFYSENFSYYSAGATATEVALDVPQARNTSGGTPEAPAAIYLGDTGLTFGLDSWGQIEANYGAAQLWVRYNDADLTGGTASDFTGFVNDEHKSRTSGQFNQTGTWYWGLRMDYGSPYGSNFWYKAASTDWADLSASGAGATLTVTVSAINDAGSQTATRSTVNPTSEIDLTWAKNAQDHNVLVVRKLAADSWTEPTPGQAYSVSDSLGAGTVVYNGSGTAASDTGLTEDSTYEFKFYSVNNDYYSAGVTAQASTKGCAPEAPTGVVANPTNYTDFTANWDAVTDATGYRIDVSTEEEFSTAVMASDLIISEYFEGSSGNNKAIEIYNGTGAAVDLSNYRLWMISNGGNWPETTNALSGILASGDVYVFTHSTADFANLTAVADGSSATLNFNGDDAVGLAKNISGTWTLIDAVGEDGVDPGTGWTVAGTANATVDHSLIRKSSVTGPTTNWAVSRGATVGDSQWTLSTAGANADAVNFGSHTFDGGTTPSFVAGFENLAVAGTSVSVTGLTEATTYYFRVRAEGEGGCPSVDSATASATTLEYLRPVFSTTNALVREAGEGRFYVRLNIAPAGVVTATVSRTAGDAGLSVLEQTSLSFDATDWDVWRSVTLAAAADDGNSANESATFEVAGAGLEAGTLDATALDDDIGDNIALASGGTTIAGVRAYVLNQAIDGVHNARTNYAYTIWTNATQGTITLDLQTVSTVNRLRILNWDWTYRTHDYKVESSVNGTAWTTMVDVEGRQGWDDWSTGNATARYLRFTGLSNSVNNGICIPEWEVYGTRTPLPQPEVSAATTLVREDGEGRFFVRLAQAPEASFTVSVTRSSGDEGMTVSAGSSLLFTTVNWATWQPVTLAATADGETAARTATFRISGARISDQFVEATVLDDDFAENLALASSGTTLSGVRAYVLAQANDGVHNMRTNYAYTVWTNPVQGTITMDLRTVSSVERVRLLNWDWTYRAHRYTIQSSVNGTDWTTLVNSSGTNQIGWDEWPIADVSMRYLRFTGLSNSVNNGICISEWEVYGDRTPAELLQFSKTEVNVREAGEGRFYVRLAEAPAANVTINVSRLSGDAGLTVLSGSTVTFKASEWNAWHLVTLAAAGDENAIDETATFRISGPDMADGFVTATALDDDIGENLALATGGATISGSRGYQGAQAIDGIHADSKNYAYTIWTNAVKGTLTLDMQAAMTVSRVRLLNWDWNYRTHRYTVESSVNGTDWTMLLDASGSGRHGWDDLPVADASIRYLRFTGLSNSVNNGICISELEVYGTRPLGKRALKASASEDGEPVTVVTSDDVAPVYESGWAALDGDLATAWTGQKAGGGYILVGYDPALELSALEVDLAEGSLADIEYLYSVDGQEWLPLPEDLETNPVSLNFLWLVFPDDGTGAVPQVLEIWPNP